MHLPCPRGCKSLQLWYTGVHILASLGLGVLRLANIFWAFGTSNFLGVSSQSMWEAPVRRLDFASQACGSMAVQLQQDNILREAVL